MPAGTFDDARDRDAWRCHARPVPDAASPDLLRRVARAGYLVGAAMSAGVTLVLDPTVHTHAPQLWGAVAMVVLAAGLSLGRRLPPAIIGLAAHSVGIVLIGAVIATARPVWPIPLYYMWPALSVAYFGSRGEVLANLVLFAGTFAVALPLSASEEPFLVSYVPTVSVFAIVAVIVRGLQERRAALLAELREAASRDPLTGLLNRRAFNAAFARETERARASKLPLSVVVLDLDHFKRLNDRHGHAAGDAALEHVAGVLRAGCGPADLAARLGGEEFALVLFGAGEADAHERAQAMLDRLEQAPVPATGTTLTTSAGVAALSAALPTPEAMLLAADRALYAAKDAGRRQVCVAGPPAGHVPLGRAA